MISLSDLRNIVNLKCESCNYTWVAPCITKDVRCPKCKGKSNKMEFTERKEVAPRV